MREGFKITAWVLGSIVVVGIFIATRLGVFRDMGNANYRRISAIVDTIKSYGSEASPEGIIDGFKEYFNENGEYPAGLVDLEPYVGKDMLYDPFNKKEIRTKQPDGTTLVTRVKQLYQYRRISHTECELWSYGPDRDNDNGEIEYVLDPRSLRGNGDIKFLHLKDGEVVAQDTLY